LFPSFDYTALGLLIGDDPYQALQTGAEMLTILRNSTSDVQLAELSKNGGKELITAILRALVNSLPRKNYENEWRVVVAKCVAEMLRLLLIHKANQVFLSQFCGFWQIFIALLSSPTTEPEVSALLWTCAAIMSPFLARSQDQDEIVRMLKLATVALNKSPASAADASFLICGASRGFIVQSGSGRALIQEICTSLSKHISSSDCATRQASITALHYFGLQFPDIAGQNSELISELARNLSDQKIGDLAAGTLYAIGRANPNALKEQQSYLASQGKRAIISKGPQSAQVSALLGLLPPSPV
jgi:hypothetical protein